jgi:hypothetical protein
MKQTIRGTTISFKCDGDSESVEKVLYILLLPTENFQMDAFKTVTKKLAQGQRDSIQ